MSGPLSRQKFLRGSEARSMIITPLAGKFLALDSTDTWVLVAFIAFIGVLLYFGVFKMVGGMLDDRAADIRRQLNEARELKEEAQAKLPPLIDDSSLFIFEKTNPIRVAWENTRDFAFGVTRIGKCI